MMQLRGRRSGFPGLSILLVLVAALVVGELGLRLLGYPRTDPTVGLFEPDPSLGYRLVAGFSSWQVFNLAAPSYSTRQEGILLERWAPRLDPVLALVVFCLGIDLKDNVHPPHASANRAHGGIQVTRTAAAAVERPMGELFAGAIFERATPSPEVRP